MKSNKIRYQSAIISKFSKRPSDNAIESQKWFGGAFFDKDGLFHLQIVSEYRKNGDVRKIIDQIEEQIVIDIVQKSYVDLVKQYYNIKNANDDNIAGVGIDCESNCIVLALRDTAEAQYYPDCQIYGFNGFHHQISIHIASALNNGCCSFSLGYPVIRESSGIRGFITAGHLTGNTQGDAIAFNGTVIGKVYEYESSSKMDATFVQLNENDRIDCKTVIEPICTLKGQAPSLLQGASVIMYGGVSGKAYRGKLCFPRFDFMEHENVMVFSYLSEDGDSGSPVLLQSKGETASLIGIHIGTFGMGDKVYSFGYAAVDINKRFSLEIEE